MKIKVFTINGQKIVNVVVIDDVTAIADKYNRWEYVLWVIATKTIKRWRKKN